MRNRSVVFIIFLLFSFSIRASQVNVRIFKTNIISTFIFSPIEGTYNIYADGKIITTLDASNIIQLSIEGDSIRLKNFENDFGKFGTLQFNKFSAQASFKIKCVFPLSAVRNYDDNLQVTLHTDKTQLLLINKVNIESYISGVVQSESGKGNNIEYYKLQSILCRTYLLAQLNRHVNEGYEVCDDVHCQAYLSKSTEKKIKEAASLTAGLVVVDSDLNLITAAFHANCGGETCNSEDVWALQKSYLKAVKDTFCTNKSNAHWQRLIAITDWNDYLKAKGKLPATSQSILGNLVCLKDNYDRAAYYVDGDFKISVKTIRNDFKLKSAFFNVKVQNDSVLFDGRGYGHVVGLCQEGAMQMSKLNYTYLQILHYYFKDVNIVDLASLSYFKQE